MRRTPASPFRIDRTLPLSPRPLTAAKRTGTEDVELAPVLPAQFFPSPSTAFSESREVALMRAVLEDALVCFDKQFMSNARRARRLACEATEWIWSSDTRWPFSFVNICAALGLDPDYVRLQLTLRRQGAIGPLQHRRRRVMAAQTPTSLAA